MNKEDLDYRRSGVDIEAGETAVQRIKGLVRHTYDQNVLSDLGSFGGLYRASFPGLSDPVLVSSTDGVGTKLRVAILAERYDTVGQDLVNHCVNDILVQGAQPLFFLDYIGTGHLSPDRMETMISGMVQACKENGCALIGGEMAEMPGFYQDDDFDLAGTIVGVVDQPDLLPGERIKEGDILLGLPSSGLHTNGYSLIRKIVFDNLNLNCDSLIPDLGASVADILLTVHKSYLHDIKPCIRDTRLHGLAHITGGGIPGNLKRIIPDSLNAVIDYPENQYPPLFQWLQQAAGLSRATMWESFNLGVGMIAVVDKNFADDFLLMTPSFVIGEIIKDKHSHAKVIVPGLD
jgi:phosphoribosylformylglycinamidine cyclo-ligase